MDPLELLEHVDKQVQELIDQMGQTLADGVCLSPSNPDPARVYANLVGRVEGWKHVRDIIDDVRQRYIDE